MFNLIFSSFLLLFESFTWRKLLFRAGIAVNSIMKSKQPIQANRNIIHNFTNDPILVLPHSSLFRRREMVKAPQAYKNNCCKLSKAKMRVISRHNWWWFKYYRHILWSTNVWTQRTWLECALLKVPTNARRNAKAKKLQSLRDFFTFFCFGARVNRRRDVILMHIGRFSNLFFAIKKFPLNFVTYWKQTRKVSSRSTTKILQRNFASFQVSSGIVITFSWELLFSMEKVACLCRIQRSSARRMKTKSLWVIAKGNCMRLQLPNRTSTRPIFYSSRCTSLS